MPKPFSERIIEALERPDYEPMKARRLARVMSIGEAELGDFHDAVDALRRVGRVVHGTKNALMLPHAAGLVTGIYRANPEGFGFVVPDEPESHADLYIASGNQGEAVTGDRVECSVIKRGKRDGKQLFGGKVVRVVERGDSRYVGELVRDGSDWYVRPDGNSLHIPIFIGDPGAKSARAGDLVVVEITQYPTEGRPARGVVVERLGKRGRRGVDLQTVVHQYHLPDQFPQEVTQEARELVKRFDPDAESANRETLFEELVVTIDPDDARDFDDAISLRRLKKRGKKAPAWELGVHIADVSHFVVPGSEIDQEAEQRGTSVYLPGNVIPMLPEVLSNGLCSLQENEPRLTKSAFIRYDEAGRVVDTRFSNTVIRSAKRLTYGQATAILDGSPGKLKRPVVDIVKNMNTLARAIQRRRMKQGMIVLDLPAVYLELNEDGQVVDAHPEDTSFSHTIIEMFMVEANEAVARLMVQRNVPAIRRIHPEPDEDSLLAMSRFLQVFGLKMGKDLSPDSMQKVLDKLKGHPQAYAVNLAVLKSMQMAEYSPELVGHFALASEHYTHFTSPIRRYPDLMVHRLLQLHLEGQLHGGGKRLKKNPSLLDAKTLKEKGRALSYLSRRAESAERELKSLKVLTLLKDNVGDTFEGVVTGVTNFGLFVQHPAYLIDGLLRIEDLGNDWWEADVKRGRIRGERSRRAFTLGDKIVIRIVEVDLPSRQLKLSLVDAEKESPGKKSRGGKRDFGAKGKKKSKGAPRRRKKSLNKSGVSK